MRKISWRVWVIVAIVLLGSAVALDRALPLFSAYHVTTASKSKLPPASHATVTMPLDQDLFIPFILPVQVNTTVTWKNNDAVTHRIITTPGYTAYINPQPFAYTVAAGHDATFLFTRPGIYHYYDTGMAGWNTSFERVTAYSRSKSYPEAMEGVIWVQGSIGELPSSALVYVLQGHGMFSQEFIAIAANGAVTWHNLDANPHFVDLVAGWSAPVNPANIGLYRLAGTNEVPGGESVTVLFHTPGLYYYYSRNHDQVDPASHRVVALPVASEYPISMEGFVLVM